MKQKVEAVKVELQRVFPDAALEYRFSEDLHKFRINIGMGAHWVIIGRETLDDHDIEGLRSLLNDYEVLRTLKESSFSRRILLTRQGATDQPIPR